MASVNMTLKTEDSEIKKRAGTAHKVAKRKRRVMSLEEKRDILDLLLQGKTNSFVGRLYGVNESTIRSIKKAETFIRASIDSCETKALKRCFIPHDPRMEKIEMMLNLWIEDKHKYNETLSMQGICDRARGVFKDMFSETEVGSEKKLTGSKGWFDKFTVHHDSETQSPMTGTPKKEPLDPATIPVLYPPQLQKVIIEGDYLPAQIFGAVETAMLWKPLNNPTCPVVEQEPTDADMKSAKTERLTLLFCANTSGHLIVKPLMLYRKLCPNLLRGKNRAKFPVYWRANRKTWMTPSLLKEWFERCFLVEVQDYLKQKNLEFKVLLILHSPFGTSDAFANVHPNVKIVFITSCVSHILEPLDQCLIQPFKKTYAKLMYNFVVQNLAKVPLSEDPSAWDSYTITNAVFLIKEALNSLTEPVINVTWEKIWLEMVKYLSAIPPEDRDSLDLEEPMDEDEHLMQMQSSTEVVPEFDKTNLSDMLPKDVIQETSSTPDVTGVTDGEDDQDDRGGRTY